MIRFLAGFLCGVAATLFVIGRSMGTAESPKVALPNPWPEGGTYTEYDGTQWTWTTTPGERAVRRERMK